MAYLHFIALTNGGVRIDSTLPTGTRVLSLLQRPLLTDRFFLPPSFCELTLSPVQVAELKLRMQEAYNCLYLDGCPELPRYDHYVPVDEGTAPSGGLRLVVIPGTNVLQLAFARHSKRYEGSTTPTKPSYYFPMEFAMATLGQKQMESLMAAL